jgi:hypothetical protein
MQKRRLGFSGEHPYSSAGNVLQKAIDMAESQSTRYDNSPICKVCNNHRASKAHRSQSYKCSKTMQTNSLAGRGL